MYELGRVDILVPVALLLQFLAAPRVGHLYKSFHVFAYLKGYNKSTLVFDDTVSVFDDSESTKCDWSELYPGASESVPPEAPQLCGESITMLCFVDFDHAGCHVTRRSHTGVLIFINKAPILWFSKQHNTVETSTFGSEFVVMRIAVELFKGLMYNL